MAVVGLTVVFTIDEDTFGFDYGRLGGRTLRVLENHDASQSITEELFDAAIHYFEETPQVQISSILDLAGRWVIAVPKNTTFSLFLARIICHYKHVSDSRQVGEAAFRNMEPVGTVWGQLSYEMLQPGSC